MDINNNNKTQNAPSFGFLKFRKNQYIPALHKTQTDTWDLSTSQKSSSKKDKGFLGSIFSGIKQKSLDSMLPAEIKPVSAEELLAKLDELDIPDDYHKKYESCINDNKEKPLNLNLIDAIFSTPILYKEIKMKNILDYILDEIKSPENAKVKLAYINKFLSDERLFENKSIQDNIVSDIEFTNTVEDLNLKFKFIDKYLENPSLYENDALKGCIGSVLSRLQSKKEIPLQFWVMNKYVSEPMLNQNETLKNYIGPITGSTKNPEQLKLVKKFFSNPELYENEALQKCFSFALWNIRVPEGLNCLDKFLSDSNLYNNKGLQKRAGELFWSIRIKESVGVVDKFLSDPEFYNNEELQYSFKNILENVVHPETVSIVDKFLSDPKLYENKYLRYQLSSISAAISRIPYDLDIVPQVVNSVQTFLSNPRMYENKSLSNNFCHFIYGLKSETGVQILDKFLSDPRLYENEELQAEMRTILSLSKSPESARMLNKILPDLANGEISPSAVVVTLKNYREVDYKKIQKLEKTVGNEIFRKISQNSTDIVAAANLIGLYGKNNINEIPIAEKRNVLRTIVKNNTDLFNISDDLKQAFPLIPTNKEEYCALLPSLVKSLGIEVKTLDSKQVVAFNSSLDELSSSLSKLSNKEFDNLSITQAYSKDEFIKDTLSIVKGLSKAEKQKVYDYFGFELHHNRKAPIGYSITGYPVNINNGKKLSQITDKNTKQVVEKLREKVIAFSENNPIQSNNSNVSQQLDAVLKFLPELRSSVGRMQYGLHEFDVLKHSLKVMQKIGQNPNFEKLNSSDKKIMMLSALLHDISKAEVVADPLHNFESSFDAYYIAKKFNLSQDEQIKMYTLINHHEWLKYVNKQGLSEEELIKRLQSVAFDFQNDNLFEMAKIFTEADIKSITKGDGLYDKFGDALKIHSKEVEEYIAELKKSKPILPTTKLPKASEIASKITNINADCSTNIKGVYVKDGLVVVRYNEVEDWEKLGFPQGSISRGIETINPVDNTQINTGNIKFIAHGLEYENQLSNFDAFALPDSDALLSVSYMERPESKYRLFRPQGVLLDVDSKYIHGGGETDSGSGYGKNIDEFKSNYIFGGVRQCDRDYISDLIKETLGFNDEEYVNFIQKNQNKSMLEIEPVEAREALIKKFALINSNTRRGNREYNEMYVSNPKVQGCFAYSTKKYIGDTIQFIDTKQNFLKDYAKENDLPFFIFGD